MITHTNEQLDALILKTLYGRTLKFKEIQSNVSGDMRQIDRRLQSLKRAGKVVFNSKTGWALVDQ
jgi:DNA-binding HxlR family transcriptional regulator